MSEHHISATPLQSTTPLPLLPEPPSSHRSSSIFPTPNILNSWKAANFLKATYFQNCFSTSRSVISPKTPLWSRAQDWQYVPQEQGKVYVSIPIAPVTIIPGIFHPRRRRESKLPVGCAKLALSLGSHPGMVIRKRKAISAGLQELMAPFNVLSLYASVSNPVSPQLLWRK